MRYYQQVSVDLVNMVYTAVAYLALAGAAWLFLRLIQACFWLPGHMRRQNDVQAMLQDKIDGYERYIAECERKEATAEGPDAPDEQTLETRRKERQECLDMLKNELRRIQDGGDPYDFDYLLDEETKKMLADENNEKKDVDDDEEEEEEKDADGSEMATEIEDTEPKKDK